MIIYSYTNFLLFDNRIHRRAFWLMQKIVRRPAMKKRTWKQKLKQCLLKKWKKAAGACTKVRENPSFKGAIWMSILLINLLLETTLSNIANQFTMELISILKMFFKILFSHRKLRVEQAVLRRGCVGHPRLRTAFL